MTTIKSVRWDQVVESDEILNKNFGTWHEITNTVLSVDGKLVKVWIKGRAVALKPFRADATVEVRRGQTGQAVDLFQVVFSGQTLPDPHQYKDTSPTHESETSE